MKYFGAMMVVAVAALAFTYGATISHAGYNGAEPSKKGTLCFKGTDGRGHGYWAPCPQK